MRCWTFKDKATADEIKKAYRKLSMVHHPDKNQGNLNASTHKFQEISAAYEILGNVQKRKMYDLKKNNPIFHMLHHGTTCKPPMMMSIMMMSIIMDKVLATF